MEAVLKLLKRISPIKKVVNLGHENKMVRDDIYFSISFRLKKGNRLRHLKTHL